jgi:tetratricopeptide (TPR) repeat protein
VGIIQVGSQAAADRYTYLPSVSIFLLAGAGVAKLCARFAGRKNIIVAGGVLAVLLAAALGQRTIAQSAVWRDSESLWTYVIKAFPGRVPVAHNNLGVLYDGRGLHDKALEEYEKAIAINPAFADARANLGVAYKRRGNYEKAIEEYQKALAANPNMAEARTNLGLAYYHQGRYDKAVAEYQKALNIDPLLAAAYYNLGLAYIAQGLDDQALEAYKKALAINSALADAHYALGLIYYSKKNYTAAKMHFDKAQELGYKIDPKLREFFKQAP